MGAGDLDLWYVGEAVSMFVYYLTGAVTLFFVVSLLVTRSLRRKEPKVFDLGEQYECQGLTVSYLIAFTTALSDGPGIPDNVKVFLQLEGENSATPFIMLKSNKGGRPILQRGHTDIFLIRVEETLGRISKARMILSGLRGPLKWRLTAVELYLPWLGRKRNLPVTVTATETFNMCHSADLVKSLGFCEKTMHSLYVHHQWLSAYNNPVRYGAFTEVVHISLMFMTILTLLTITQILYILLPRNGTEDTFYIDLLSLVIASVSASGACFILCLFLELTIRHARCREKRKIGVAYRNIVNPQGHVIEELKTKAEKYLGKENATYQDHVKTGPDSQTPGFDNFGLFVMEANPIAGVSAPAKLNSRSRFSLKRKRTDYVLPSYLQQLINSASLVQKQPTEQKTDVQKQPTEQKTDVQKQPTEQKTYVQKQPTEQKTDVQKQPTKQKTDVQKQPTEQKTDVQKQPTEQKTDVQKQPTEQKTDVQKQPTEQKTDVQKQPTEQKTDVQKQPTKQKTYVQKQPTEQNTDVQKQPTEQKTDVQKQPTEQKTDVQKQPTEQNTYVQKQPTEQKTDVQKQPTEQKTDVQKQPTKQKSANRRTSHIKRTRVAIEIEIPNPFDDFHSDNHSLNAHAEHAASTTVLAGSVGNKYIGNQNIESQQTCDGNRTGNARVCLTREPQVPQDSNNVLLNHGQSETGISNGPNTHQHHGLRQRFTRRVEQSESVVRQSTVSGELGNFSGDHGDTVVQVEECAIASGNNHPDDLTINIEKADYVCVRIDDDIGLSSDCVDDVGNITDNISDTSVGETSNNGGQDTHDDKHRSPFTNSGINKNVNANTEDDGNRNVNTHTHNHDTEGRQPPAPDSHSDYDHQCAPKKPAPHSHSDCDHQCAPKKPAPHSDSDCDHQCAPKKPAPHSDSDCDHQCAPKKPAPHSHSHYDHQCAPKKPAPHSHSHYDHQCAPKKPAPHSHSHYDHQCAPKKPAPHSHSHYDHQCAPKKPAPHSHSHYDHQCAPKKPAPHSHSHCDHQCAPKKPAPHSHSHCDHQCAPKKPAPHSDSHCDHQCAPKKPAPHSDSDCDHQCAPKKPAPHSDSDCDHQCAPKKPAPHSDSDCDHQCAPKKMRNKTVRKSSKSYMCQLFKEQQTEIVDLRDVDQPESQQDIQIKKTPSYLSTLKEARSVCNPIDDLQWDSQYQLEQTQPFNIDSFDAMDHNTQAISNWSQVLSGYALDADGARSGRYKLNYKDSVSSFKSVMNVELKAYSDSHSSGATRSYSAQDVSSNSITGISLHRDPGMQSSSLSSADVSSNSITGISLHRDPGMQSSSLSSADVSSNSITGISLHRDPGMQSSSLSSADVSSNSITGISLHRDPGMQSSSLSSADVSSNSITGISLHRDPGMQSSSLSSADVSSNSITGISLHRDPGMQSSSLSSADVSSNSITGISLHRDPGMQSSSLSSAEPDLPEMLDQSSIEKPDFVQQKYLSNFWQQSVREWARSFMQDMFHTLKQFNSYSDTDFPKFGELSEQVVGWIHSVMDQIPIAVIVDGHTDVREMLLTLELVPLLFHMAAEVVLISLRESCRIQARGFNNNLGEIIAQSHRLMTAVREAANCIIYCIENREADTAAVLTESFRKLDLELDVTNITTEMYTQCVHVTLNHQRCLWNFCKKLQKQQETAKHNVVKNAILSKIMMDAETKDDLKLSLATRQICQFIEEDAKKELAPMYEDERNVFTEVLIKQSVLHSLTLAIDNVTHKKKHFVKVNDLEEKMPLTRKQKIMERIRRKKDYVEVKDDDTVRMVTWDEKEKIQKELEKEVNKIHGVITMVQAIHDSLKRRWERLGLKTRMAANNLLCQTLLHPHVKVELFGGGYHFTNILHVKRMEAYLSQFLRKSVDHMTRFLVKSALSGITVTNYQNVCQDMIIEDIVVKADGLCKMLLPDMESIMHEVVQTEAVQDSLHTNMPASTISLDINMSAKNIHKSKDTSNEEPSTSSKKSSNKDVSKKQSSSKDVSTKNSSSKDLSKKNSSSKDLSKKNSSKKDLSKKNSSSKDLSKKNSSSKDISKKNSSSKDVSKKNSSSKDVSMKKQTSKVKFNKTASNDEQTPVGEEADLIRDMIKDLKLLKFYLSLAQTSEGLRNKTTVYRYAERCKRRREYFCNINLQNFIDSYYMIEEGDDSNIHTKQSLYQLEYDVLGESDRALPGGIKTFLMFIVQLMILFGIFYITTVGSQFTTTQLQEWVCYFLLALAEFGVLLEPLRALIVGSVIGQR